jgi:predicted ArsR family transcriptional regulator
VLLADPAGEHTADSLAAQMGLKDTAMHNRLAKLRAAGLAHRASFAGRKAFWKAGAAPAAPSSP